MSNVTGPTTNLPGTSKPAPEGVVCDNHSREPAYRRVTGEVDSHGSEEHDLCMICWTKNQMKAPGVCGNCKWCNKFSDDLKVIRDFEEGLMGPVYEVCQDCRKRQANIVREEYELECGGQFDDEDRNER